MSGLDEVNHCHLAQRSLFGVAGGHYCVNGRPGYEHPVEYPHYNGALAGAHYCEIPAFRAFVPSEAFCLASARIVLQRPMIGRISPRQMVSHCLFRTRPRPRLRWLGGTPRQIPCVHDFGAHRIDGTRVARRWSTSHQNPLLICDHSVTISATNPCDLAICGKIMWHSYEHPVEYPHSQRAHFPVRTIAKLPHSGHSSPVKPFCLASARFSAIVL